MEMSSDAGLHYTFQLSHAAEDSHSQISYIISDQSSSYSLSSLLSSSDCPRRSEEVSSPQPVLPGERIYQYNIIFSNPLIHFISEN